MRYKLSCTLMIMLVYVNNLNAHVNLKRISLKETIKATLLKDPNIYLEKERVKNAYGNFQQAEGQFDPLLDLNFTHERTQTPLIRDGHIVLPNNTLIDENIEDFSLFNFSLKKQFRNGVTIGPEVLITRRQDTFKHLGNQFPENRADVNFGIDIPLLRNSYPGANAEANSLIYKAATNNYCQFVSQEVLNSIVAYWNVVAAKQRLAIRKRAENQSFEFSNNLKKLIEADLIPRAELTLSEADLASKRSATLEAQTQLALANQVMNISIGEEYCFNQTLTVKDNTFPAVNFNMVKEYQNLSKYISTAMARRCDIVAGKLVVNANSLLVRQAVVDLNPALNVQMRVGYSGLQEGGGMFESLTQNTKGPNYFAGAHFNYPITNHFARGTLNKQNAAAITSRIDLHNLVRTIQYNIQTIMQEIAYTSKAIVNSTESLKHYRKAWQDELTKLKHGNTTVLDVIRVQDQWIFEELTMVQLKAQYITAINRFRFETGTLLLQEKGHFQVPITGISRRGYK